MSYHLVKTKTDRVIDVIIYGILALFALFALFPLYYVVIMSVTPITEVFRNGGYVIIPRGFTLDAYKAVFASPTVPQAFKITVIITLVGTALNLIVTSLLAYPLSKKPMPGRNIILFLIVFTMLFSGGLIPLYLVVRATGLLDTIWAMIIPGMVSAFNMLIMKTFFENLPDEIEDAARVDGCGDISTLIRIVVPLSTPIIATMGLFYGVTHWNEYFKGIMYLNDRTLYPIQVVLRNMIQTASVSSELAVQSSVVQELPPETIKMAVVVVALLPIVAIYPFLQKYFMKGMLLGAVKG
ncbi:carbohydrate ABC transporter permease [Paenibacillus senegalensis]|uniref:carbohydrate ABC transporter permease n=1 Tax=Paenibacillus senegalensis TaxID=1465766 RepID=UPI0002885F3E|nr:carbohydrate ABC transporter permease [Paenibacillus senegalensis]